MTNSEYGVPPSDRTSTSSDRAIRIVEGRAPTVTTGWAWPASTSAKDGGPVLEGGRFSSSGAWLYARRLRLLATLLAAPVLVRPILGLLAIIVGGTLVSAWRGTSEQRGKDPVGPAAVVALPLQLILALGRSVPDLVLRAALVFLAALVGAVVAVAASAAVRVGWAAMVHHDGDLLLWSQVRAALVGSGSRWGLFVASYVLLSRQLGGTSSPRLMFGGGGWPQTPPAIPATANSLDRLGEVGVTALALAAMAAVGVGALLPVRYWAPFEGYRAAAETLRVDGRVDKAIIELTEAHARHGLECSTLGLSGATLVREFPGTTVRIDVYAEDAVGESDVLLGMTLLHNALVLPIDTIILTGSAEGQQTIATLDRRALGVGTAVEDPSRLLPFLSPALDATVDPADLACAGLREPGTALESSAPAS